MDYCSYHPLSPATYACPHCGTGNCDNCVDEGDRGEDIVCFNCKQGMDFLGAGNHATPFWRRLEESFRYPVDANAAGLIISVSVLTTILLYVPFGFVLFLMLTGAFMKYCFSALDSTAQGLLVPPDITTAYNGGMRLLLQLLVIFIAVGGATFGVYRLLGPEFAGLFTFLAVMALPAIIIIFAMTDSLSEALNPGNILRLIAAIGLPYGLLLGFIMIMTTSVGVISSLFAGHLSLLSTILESIVSNYYMLVIFHIMGYMIFQYQGNLGFAAREDTGELKEPRSARDRLAARVDIRLKEGDYNDVVRLLQSALKKYPGDRDFQKQYFEFIYATERLQALEEAATQYLIFLVKSDQEHQLSIIYRRVLHLLPNFIPNSPVVRHRLAIACKEKGDAVTAVKLINGLQKAFPDYDQLPEAINVMADALEHLPNKSEQAAKCRALANNLAQRRPKPVETKPKPAPKAQQKAVFSIDPLPAAPTTPPTSDDVTSVEDNSAEDSSDSNGELPPIEFK